MTFSLYPDQTAFIEGLSQSFNSNKRVLGVACTGFGKCLGRGTPVLMFDGTIKAVEDVGVGDVLMGPDSQPRTVVSTCTGREPLYRVVPNKGEPYVVNQSHILSLRMTGNSNQAAHACGGQRFAPGEIANVEVRDYLAATASFRYCAKGWRVGVDFREQPIDPDLPPYLLGIWLGDGDSRTCGVTTADDEVADYLRCYAAERGMTVRDEPAGGRSRTHHVTMGRAGNVGRGHRNNPMRRALHEAGVVQNKHIPHRYLATSRTARLELLAGLLDSDGYYFRCGYEFSSKSERLADGVCFLARSLGLAAYKKPVEKAAQGSAPGKYFIVWISGDCSDIPCRLPRKKAAQRKQVKSHLVTGIRLEPIGEGDYFGFEIAGPDRLFLLGDFTVTHNTVCFADIVRRTVERGHRVVVVAHRIEIVRQIGKALARSGVAFGWVLPGQSTPVASVLVGMVQTVANRLDALQPPKLLVVDEAHHATAGSYKKITDAWKDSYVLGVTATPARTDGRGLGDVFDGIVEGPPMAELIARGRLSGFQYFAPPVTANLSGVKTRGGDYALDQLAEAMDRRAVTGDAVRTYAKHLNGRPAIAFCVSVEHAKNVAQQFAEAGWKAESVDGATDPAVRADRIAAIGDGRLNVLTSCDIISEGTDIPVVAGAILLRPTQSLIVYLQQVGRVLRPKPDNSRAVILDHCGNVLTHGMPDQPREWGLEGRAKRQGPAPVRQCPKCYAAFAPAPKCPSCGHVLVAAPKARTAGKVVEGELAEVKEVKREPVKREDLVRMVAAAKTLPELQALSKRLGYQPGWAWVTWQKRQQMRAALGRRPGRRFG